MSNHLNILHLEANTGIPKIDEVANCRYGKLMEELISQGITKYTIWPGEFIPDNPKLAIHLGHRKIVQHAQASNWSNCIIGEDDFRFTSPNSWKYFLSQMPESYDLFMGLVYSGTIENNRVLNGFSGGLTLYSIHERYYQEFIDLPLDTHIDRECGLSCYSHEFFVTPEVCVTQRGGFSIQRREEQFYDCYLEGKKIFCR